MSTSSLRRLPVSFRSWVLRLTLLATAALLLSSIGCSSDDVGSASSTSASSTPTSADTASSDSSHAGHDHAVAAGATSATGKKGEKAARHPNERPVPAFEGTTLSGTRLKMRDLVGTRLVLFFFNPEVPKAAPVARAVHSLEGRAADNNFKILGVGIGSTSAELSRFAKEQKFEFPILDDSSGSISQQLRLQVPVALLGIDADGYVSFGLAGFPEGDAAEESARKDLQDALRVEADSNGALYAWAGAPDLGVVALSNGEVIETSDLAGRASIVIFFLHTCPHCHHALQAIQKTLASIPEGQKPRLVAVSVQNAPGAIRKAMADLNLDFFDPYLDPGGKAADRWGVTGGVPVVHVLDDEGKIRHRIQGWNDKRDPSMLRMHVAKASGTKVPMILDPTGYSGNEVCGVCHEQELATWHFTKHATAFDTLVTHAADRRTDCVSCHVVGFGEKGGYNFTSRPAHLEGVGCESCHGRGGPHLSPGFVPLLPATGGSAATQGLGRDYAQVCATCHNKTHSLGFDYDTFHPRVSHEAIADMTNDERLTLLGGAGPSRELLPTNAQYVGSMACQSCHTKEFETWEASPHGHAVATLEKAGEEKNTECLMCHTTAFGKPGGFPADAAVGAYPDLARVGCESCHGPGGDHIGENAKRVGTILSLGDKCDSCVILKVCGTCHDDVNDPGFQFEVEQRIEDQRHGTIESAATRAGESAFHQHLPKPGFHALPSEPGLAAAHDRVLLDSLLKAPNSEPLKPATTPSTSRPARPAAIPHEPTADRG